MNWIVLLLICNLLQVQFASSASLSEENTAKLSKLFTKIQTFIQTQMVTLVKEKKQHESVVGTAKQSLNIELEQLRQYIKETNNEAVEYDKDIADCYDEESLNTLDINNIDGCSQLSHVDYIEDVLRNFTKRVKNLNEEMEEITVDGFDSQINEFENNLTIMEFLIPTLLRNAEEMCLRCTNVGLTGFGNEIINIARNFTRCADNIMEYVN